MLPKKPWLLPIFLRRETGSNQIDWPVNIGWKKREKLSASFHSWAKIQQQQHNNMCFSHFFFSTLPTLYVVWRHWNYPGFKWVFGLKNILPSYHYKNSYSSILSQKILIFVLLSTKKMPYKPTQSSVKTQET